MSPLTFRLKKPTAQRVDMSPLTPHVLAGMATTEINGTLLQSGKRQFRVDELFEVSGTDSHHLIIKGSNSKLDYIGRGIISGKIVVEGDTGAYTGMEMKGGNLIVNGNVGLFAACEMRQGLIHVNGNAGDFLGGALPGHRKGMQGGMVVVKGNTGSRLGDCMRRGMILVEGNAGDYCGSRMIAGTIAVMGSTGNHPGYAMNRGTLLLWQTPELSPTFADCGLHTSASFLPLLFRSFRNLNSRFAEKNVEFHRVQRYAGDLSGLGKGEILVKIQ